MTESPKVDPSHQDLPESLPGKAYRLCTEGDRRWCLLRRLINLLYFWKIDYCAGRHYEDLHRRPLPGQDRDGGH
ncbi:hypothetical protein [Ectothiorhodospira lacustris]|uniref:hypothetical protein n=1 Tax=Ectothiorhodospira lacustris TaxID=2899127 RepID=UPI001EE821C0|nr:hypothetical protein [Ectothiorhodospira lacustris]MCG5501859.1 hypothetical protein [Ectothiorhodospira lacustris]MCG5511208.1 hypothetical protein [Ectothiorhodospira lacustris]MCG5522976.1 hypothetical protein [Ectothiorhodospira lacustris]